MKYKGSIWGWLLLYGVVAYGGYYYFYDKKRFAKKIASSGMYGGGVTALMTFDRGYLAAWAKGINDGSATFSYKNGTYNTKGGKVKR